MWQALRASGYAEGRVLEPGCGTGNFISAADNPEDMLGVEIDPISALIASVRHPDAQIRRESFVDLAVADNSVVATIGNVPFDQVAPYDPDRNRMRLSTHDYFISKSIDLTAPGGYVAVISSTHTADNRASKTNLGARQAFAERADFITGARLPGGRDGAFSDTAGTQVATDVLVFRVREDGQQPTELTQTFIDTAAVTIDGTELEINRFFAENPDHVLGTPTIVSGRFGPQLQVAANGDHASELGDRLEQVLVRDVQQAVGEGLGHTANLATLEQAGHIDTAGLIDDAATDLHQVLGTLRYDRNPDGSLYFERLSQLQTQAPPEWEPVQPARKYAEQWASLLDLRDTTTALLTACANNDTAQITALRGTLNRQYDQYVDAYGPINLHEDQAPRRRTDKQIEREFSQLESQWRAENAVGDRPYEGPLPEDEVDRLRDEAQRPNLDPTPVRRHLKGAIASDPFITTVTALEHYNEITRTATKGALFSTNPIRTVDEPNHAESVPDALLMLTHSARDITATNLAELLGPEHDVDSVTKAIEADRLAFRDPADPDLWIPATTYLSGPVRTKLREAEALADDDARFLPNVAALQATQPTKITEGITINLGATWIPQEIYRDFLCDALHIPRSESHQVGLVRVVDEWRILLPKHWSGQDAADMAWGVRAANANGEYNFATRASQYRHLSHHGVAHRGRSATVFSAAQSLEAAMNMSAPRLNFSLEAKVHMGIENPERVTLVHSEATRFAGRKVDELSAHFGKWATSDAERHGRLIDAYNEVFNNVVAPVYDGTDRELVGLSEKFHPYPYQLNAVERIVHEEAVLLNHVVGAGKTGSMIMGAMELRRLGLATKPMLVVPNHLTEQIAREAKQWYPGASILSGAGARGGTEERQAFMAQVATHDWDLVVVPESVFRRIPVSPEVETDYLTSRLEALREDLRTLGNHEDSQKYTVKEIERRVKRMEGKLKEVQDKIGGDLGVTFDQAGIDYLIVDEAHGYKNLGRQSSLADLAHPGSQKATDMDMKLEHIRSTKRPGQPMVTFATGTPISNNIAELWVMQHYLRPDLLDEANVPGVNAWGANFTEKVTEVDFTAAGAIKESTKVSRYVNVADLARMCSPFMDYVGREQIPAKLPELHGGKTQVVEFDPGQEVKDFNRDLLWRESMMSTVNDPRIDNPLNLIGHGKTATLDPRLAGLEHIPGVGRVHALAESVHEVWEDNRDNVYLDQFGEESPNRGGFQVVFCDRGVPKPGRFSVYEALRDELVTRGMDRDRIRFIHDWDDQRLRLFDDCNNGRVDVLIGNTEKLGTGANIQARCTAIHHADVPWRPADLEQRLGRGLRQGNQNAGLLEAVYIGAGTHDGFSWGTVSRKAAFIEQFYRADQKLREMEPLEGSGDAMAHHKAIATGNPDFVRQMELQRVIDALESARTEHEAMKASNARELSHNRLLLPQQQRLTERLAALAPAAQAWQDSPTEERTWTIGTTLYTTRTDATAALTRELAAVARSRSTDPVPVAEIGGVELRARYSYEYSSLMLSSPVAKFPDGIPENIVRDDLVRTDDVNQTLSQKRSGILTRMETGVTSITQRAAMADEDLHRVQKTIERLENLPTAGDFPRADELAAAQNELKEVNARITAFSKSDAERQAQADYEERLAQKGRVHGFSLALNPTRYMREERMTRHPESPALDLASVDQDAMEQMWVDTTLIDSICGDEPYRPGQADNYQRSQGSDTARGVDHRREKGDDFGL